MVACYQRYQHTGSACASTTHSCREACLPKLCLRLVWIYRSHAAHDFPTIIKLHQRKLVGDFHGGVIDLKLHGRDTTSHPNILDLPGAFSHCRDATLLSRITLEVCVELRRCLCHHISS